VKPWLELEAHRSRLRACIKIGEISRELEKSPQASGGRHDNDVAPTKTEALEQAGINLRTAERYEELTGGREEQALARYPRQLIFY
jgi:hypothetical protein